MIDGKILLLALIVGGANWLFRFLPMRLRLADARPGGILARFLAATGPAAIATLFTASVLPMAGQAADLVLLAAGMAGVGLAYRLSRSVVLATLAGSAAYGAAFALMAMG